VCVRVCVCVYVGRNKRDLTAVGVPSGGGGERGEGRGERGEVEGRVE